MKIRPVGAELFNADGQANGKDGQANGKDGQANGKDGQT